MTSKWVFAALCAALSALPGSAEGVPNIAGHWTFTARIQAECSFGGTAFLERSGEGYAGELTARQSCLSLEEDYIVRQSCKVSLLGNQASVRCQIAEFVNGFESEYYYPDNFTLTIASSDHMHGALVSGSVVPAEWKRSEGGIS